MGGERLLERINSPADLKKLDEKELPRLASEIRDEIIDTVSQGGGHLASSLGAVELAIGLHYVLNVPQDIIIWDVGHQAYAHKLLTGRRDSFKTIRQAGGLSGFPNKNESVFDTFTTGHGSTSISTALGMVAARELTQKEQKIVAVIGDASLGGGMALEALNHAGHMKKDLLVLLNDNEMSIAPSVGAISGYLNRIITAPIYNRMRNDIEKLVRRIVSRSSRMAGDKGEQLGNIILNAARRMEEGLKNLLVPGILFEELGFRYFGPINGHDLNIVIATLRNVSAISGPVLMHVLTKKGKGYHFAEKLPEKFHGVGSFDVITGKNKPPPVASGLSKEKDGRPETDDRRKISFTQGFSEHLIKLAEKDERIVAITAAMPEGTGLDKFAECFPERFFDVGMAEQHAVGFAAGFAKGGYKPVAAIYSTFLQRAYDQIIHDVCLQDLHVVLALDRAGLVGEDGPTHHGIFDISYLRHIPGLVLLAPKDIEELGIMLEFAVNYSGPIAIRYPRGSVLGHQATGEGQPEAILMGKAEVLREGKDIAIVALGSMVYPGLEAAEILAGEGIEITVVNARFVSPLDKELLQDLCAGTRFLVTVEEGVLEGGFGSAILELLNLCLEREEMPVIRNLGLPSEFITHAKRELLLEEYGLTAQGIAKFIKSTFVS